MKYLSVIAMGAALFAAASCAPATDVDEGPGADDAAVTNAQEEDLMATGEMNETASCPVLDSRNWSAWVNAMPGPDAKLTLHVTGEIDLPTPGYEVSWEEGMADRSMTPVQRLILTATPPDGMVAQVVTAETVAYEGPALVKTYKGVIVMCGGEPLAEINDVTIAE